LSQKILHIHHAFTALQNGDEKGLAYYFNKYYASLAYFSYNITASETVSEEIVAEGFLKLWNNRTCLQQETHVKHYLFRVVRNDSINYLREKKKNRQRENTLLQLMPLSEEQILEKWVETETYHQLFLAYESLPEKCRHVLEMFYFEGKSVKQIAKELSISTNTVKSQKQRALQLLRDYKISCPG
jgi:RNA polymerase sigma-70 factor (ECF subfamily)